MVAVDYWGVLVGIGLLATVLAAAAFVRHRDRETERLASGASLAGQLRELAQGDVVRLAAVDEYEVALYQRLFSVSTVSPRIRSAVWALVGAVLAAAGGLATRGDGLYLSVLHGASIVLAAIFGIAALSFAGLAVFHAATTPRVSFAESYAAAPARTEAATPRTTELDDAADSVDVGDADSAEASASDSAQDPAQDTDKAGVAARGANA